MSFHHISLNSADRVNYANTNPADCSIKLPRIIRPQCIELAAAQFPNTYFNLNRSCSDYRVNATTYSVYGNYSLMETLEKIASDTGLLVSYNDNEHLITFSGENPFTLDFTVNNSIYAKLGFLNKVYSGGVIYKASYGPKIYDSSLYINISNIPGGVITSNPTLTSASFIVPNNVNKGEIIQFYSQTQCKISPHVRDADFQYFDIKVYNDQGILLTGLCDWTMLIKVYY